ncbi:iron-siderophore ABC transporter substrate-binding protein [Kallotenue papyrolyticum]|uniref:iron-siderophore ABC transporter substrate-binding protein n=1 Tax=Kallotenue papyrolyticum TaxID=1325125 RepID=UPI00047857C4|nr:iron-siderophore ABC transporter substrate-binding protein [Kallotenue papyrolyticum]
MHWRTLLLGLLVVALSACQTPSAAPRPSSAAREPGPSAAATTPTDAFPVTITHKYGSSTIPAPPTRVITLGYTEQDPVLALGVIPIAVRDWFGDQPSAVWPWAREQLGTATPTVLRMPFGELNFEQLAALDPDLIIATHAGITAEEYATLSQIAPTLAPGAEYAEFGMPWQEQTRVIGQALGRSAQAEALIAEVEQRIATTRAAHPEFAGATIAWASPADTPGQYWIVAPHTPPMRFLQTLGWHMPPALVEAINRAGDAEIRAQIGAEALSTLDADVLIWQVATPEQRATIEQDPLYQQLAVAREQRAIFFVGWSDPIYGALSFSTVLSLPYALEQLTPQLAAALARKGNATPGATSTAGS